MTFNRSISTLIYNMENKNKLQALFYIFLLFIDTPGAVGASHYCFYFLFYSFVNVIFASLTLTLLTLNVIPNSLAKSLNVSTPNVAPYLNKV